MTLPAFGVVLAWEPSPDASVVGYAVYTGTNSGSYQTRVDAGNQTSANIEILANGNTYYFVVTAYTVSGLESLPSNEVSYTPAATLAGQTITFGALAAKTYGAAAFSLSATSSSGLTVNFSSANTSVATISGNTVTIVGAGSTEITASQAGNSSYSAATNVERTLTVNPAAATVTLSGLNTTYDGTAKTVGATTSPSGLPVALTYSGSSTAPVNVGNYAVVATVNHTNYSGSKTGTLKITKSSQTISFAALANNKVGDPALPLNATSSSGLLVSFSSGNPSVATIAGNTLTIVGAGSTVITASQAGNSNYSAAADVAQTLTVDGSTPGVLLISETPDGLNQRLRFSVGPGQNWQLQTSENGVDWDTLCELDAVANGWIDFFDPITPSQPARSYRLVSEPTDPTVQQNVVSVSPNELSLSSTATPLKMRIKFSVGANRHWQLLGSEDFINWSILCELNASADGSINVFDRIISSRPARFYRLASEPTSE